MILKKNTHNAVIVRRNLETNDWKGLAGRIYSEIFSPCFLTPLEPTDCGFRLEVQHVNLTKYAAMIDAEQPNDDMDMVSRGLVRVGMRAYSTHEPLSL